MKKTFVLATEYITLGQFLKEINVIGSGGQAKWYLADNSVFVDGELE
ncbi:RNA-binding S4 domain-containing protein, partial [Enterococcus faecalis]